MSIESPNDADDLLATQQKRWDLLDQVLTKGLDPKVASAASRLIDGVDKQILTRQRIQIETKAGSTNDALAREIILAIRKESKGVDTARVAVPLDAVGFTLPEVVLPTVSIVSGATSVGICTERFDEFQGRMEKEEEYTGKEMDNTPKHG